MRTRWWFTSDTHFDHTWLAGQRGFSDPSSHDQHLIETWNKHVRGGDVVVVCGDVFWNVINMSYNMNIWKRLHGNKIFLKGNHDRRWVKQTDWPSQVKDRKIYHKLVKSGTMTQYIVACHYPIAAWDKKNKGAIHVHGHSHGNTDPIEGRLDVGVDVAKLMLGEFRPFSFEEVMYLTKGVVHDRS